MLDFTFNIYKQLLFAMLDHFKVQTFQDYLTSPAQKVLILRHDVDRYPANALAMARIENELSIQSSYYFRAIPSVFDESIIKEIAALGHEIGYHYEDISLLANRHKNINLDRLSDQAWSQFCSNLERFRELFPVKTICMHGSPLSRYDNRLIWNRQDYRTVGIIGEPYFDVDFSQVFYLTDTGRRWNSERFSVRDKVQQPRQLSGSNIQSALHTAAFNSTRSIINHINTGRFPYRVMINVHPQRWFPFGLSWARELIGQNARNIIKMALIYHRRDCNAVFSILPDRQSKN